MSVWTQDLQGVKDCLPQLPSTQTGQRWQRFGSQRSKFDSGRQKSHYCVNLSSHISSAEENV